MFQPDDQRCVICEGRSGALCQTFSLSGVDGLGFACQVCGDYEVSRTALVNWFGRTNRLDALQSAALSHQVRIADRETRRPLLTSDWLDRFAETARLPTPALQAVNLLRVVGDYQARTGEGYFVDGVPDAPLVGAFNTAMFEQLLRELLEKRLLVRVGEPVTRPNPRGDGMLSGSLFGLSLDGWERYEAERSGKVAGGYGFIAMKFNDPMLEALVAATIKPGIQAGLGYQVVDVRDVAQAGVIDNIMRQQIRDAAFVLVDLTHDNAGAYWEAGYAEGLGKPVVYLCERAKFDQAKTHFDTNHCTTVIWSLGAEEQFVAELTATLRRSLDLFAR